MRIRDELNILFTCAGRRVRLIESFRAVLGQLGLKGELTVAELTSAAAACHVADRHVLVPSVKDDQYVISLLNVVQQHGVGLIVPLSDWDLLALAQHRDTFNRAGCEVMIAAPELVAACADKRRTNELIATAGLEPIASYTLKEFLDEPFYPCFIKPVERGGALGAARLDDEASLRTHVAGYGEVTIVQEYIGGQEFTMDVYRSRDGQVRCVVPRQRLKVRSGEVQKSITVRDEQLIKATMTLSDHLNGVWGVFSVQCRRAEAGSPPRFFDINPRFGGGAPLSIAAQANLPLYLLQEVLGLPITASLGDFTDHLLMLRFEDAFYAPVEDAAKLPGYRTPEFT